MEMWRARTAEKQSHKDYSGGSQEEEKSHRGNTKKLSVVIQLSFGCVENTIGKQLYVPNI